MKDGNEEKIKLAKKLLWEVAQDRRCKERIALENDLCKCGHKRKRHGASHSINYTEGFCQDCDCEHFTIGRSRERMRRYICGVPKEKCFGAKKGLSKGLSESGSVMFKLHNILNLWAIHA